jgi:hypothetical protein
MAANLEQQGNHKSAKKKSMNVAELLLEDVTRHGFDWVIPKNVAPDNTKLHG